MLSTRTAESPDAYSTSWTDSTTVIRSLPASSSTGVVVRRVPVPPFHPRTGDRSEARSQPRASWPPDRRRRSCSERRPRARRPPDVGAMELGGEDVRLYRFVDLGEELEVEGQAGSIRRRPGAERHLARSPEGQVAAGEDHAVRRRLEVRAQPLRRRASQHLARSPRGHDQVARPRRGERTHGRVPSAKASGWAFVVALTSDELGRSSASTSSSGTARSGNGLIRSASIPVKTSPSVIVMLVASRSVCASSNHSVS